jgi:hypothetical protein
MPEGTIDELLAMISTEDATKFGNIYHAPDREHRSHIELVLPKSNQHAHQTPESCHLKHSKQPRISTCLHYPLSSGIITK